MLYVAVAIRGASGATRPTGPRPWPGSSPTPSSASSSPTPTSPCGGPDPTSAATTPPGAVTYVWLGQALLMTVAALGRRLPGRPAGADPHRRHRRRPLPAGGPPRLVAGQPTSAGRRSTCSRRGVVPTADRRRSLFDARAAALAAHLGWRSCVLGAARGRGQLRGCATWSRSPASGCSTPSGVRAVMRGGRDVLLRDAAAARALPRRARRVARALPWAARSRCPPTSSWAQHRARGCSARWASRLLWARRAARRLPGRAAGAGDPQGGGPGWLSRRRASGG